jgi:pimeloyl-ACP methyl ester carboxylesterase
MPELSNIGVRISYDVLGQGRPLVLLHGWSCDRSWWTEPGYVDDLKRDHHLINVDLRGHGASDKPHEPAAYRADVLTSDVLAVADEEGLDRFAIWGQSYGGLIAWMTANAVSERVVAIISSGYWDPRPISEDPPSWYSAWYEQVSEALLRSGGEGLIEVFKEEEGEAFPRAYPAWAQAVTLRVDPLALLAAEAQLTKEGLTDRERFPVPALLIAGELEDPNDEAAVVAGMIPNGQSLRLPGLGHPEACAASGLTLPTARAFLDRWFV